MSTPSPTQPAGDEPSPPRPPDPERLPPGQRARRDRIIAAALVLLGQAEYEDVQMRDVAEEAGVALGTVYRYFSSKEHLYAAALVTWAADYGLRRPGSASGAPEAENDEERLRQLMRRAVRGFERSPQMFRAQMVIERSTDANARELYEIFTVHNMRVLTGALCDLDPATAAAVVTTANCVMSNYLRAWAHGRCSIRDVDHAVQRTIDLIYGPPPA